MSFFWASFILQIIVYSYLSHVIQILHDSPLVITSIFCVLLYVPFTIMLLKKFKTMATLKSDDQHATGLPMNEYILQHHDLLASFYKFKKRYEIILVVLSAAIMTWMVFRIYSTGGVNAHPTAASIIFILSLASCATALHSENKKNFEGPLKQLENLLKELKQ